MTNKSMGANLTFRMSQITAECIEDVIQEGLYSSKSDIVRTAVEKFLASRIKQKLKEKKKRKD